MSASDMICFPIENIGSVETAESFYWGTAPTGMPHVGYLIPFRIITDLIKKGKTVRVLIADKHALIEGVPESVLAARSAVYRIIIEHFLPGVEIIMGSQFQDTMNYMNDVFRYTNTCTIQRATRAASGVVKEASNPLLSSIMYPIMQAVDDLYMGCDAQIGGTDQRRIFMLSRQLAGSKRMKSYICHEMLRNGDSKMSASSGSKISFNDSDKMIRRAVSRMNTEYIPSEDCMLVQIASVCSTFPVTINDRSYSDMEQLKNAYLSAEFSVIDMNIYISNLLISIISPIRNKLSADLIKSCKF